MLEQEEHRPSQHVLGGGRPAREDIARERQDLVGVGCPAALGLRADQLADEIVAGSLAAPAHHVRHVLAHLERHSQLPLPALLGHPGEPGDLQVGPLLQQRPVRVGDAEQMGHHRYRQGARELVHEVTFASRREAVDQPIHDLLDPACVRLDPSRLERSECQVVLRLVSGRIGFHDVVAADGLSKEAEAVQAGPAADARERHGVAGDAHDVVVARDHVDIGAVGNAVNRSLEPPVVIDGERALGPSTDG